MEEATAKYPRQWIGVTVENRDESGQPETVKVVYKDLDLEFVRKNTEVNICTFYTGPIPETGLVLML
jgi:hypothetical protein